MKRWIAGLLTVFVVTQTQAQLAGLPIATDGTPKRAGAMAVSGGLVLGDDFNLYGGRFTLNPIEPLALFGDLGIVDPDNGDSEIGFQVGGMFSLPPIENFPLQLALRGALGYVSFDEGAADIDLWTLMGGVVASHAVNDLLSVYGILGFNHSRAKAKVFGSSDTESETDPAVGVGVLLRAMPQLSFYGELVHIDDLWVGLGARWDI